MQFLGLTLLLSPEEKRKTRRREDEAKRE